MSRERRLLVSYHGNMGLTIDYKIYLLFSPQEICSVSWVVNCSFYWKKTAWTMLDTNTQNP